MEKEKYAYLGKPLDVEDLLQGMGKLFNPKEKTSFKWTEELFEKNYGQILWIKRELPRWIDIIDTMSGAHANNYKFKNSNDPYVRGRIRSRYWRITFEFEISGSVEYGKLHPALSKRFSGFFKGFLAEELLRRFPFPFKNDVSKEIPFRSGMPGMYIFVPQNNYLPSLENAKNIVSSDEFKQRMMETIKKHGAKLIVFRKSREEKMQKFDLCHPVMFVKWQRDTYERDRFSLKKDIESIQEEMGATYEIAAGPKSKTLYQYPFYRVDFEF